jgi:chromosome segregation ATPase
MQQIFTALPEYYTLTDFDIHVNDSTEITKDVETIKAFTQELIKAGIIDAQTAVDSIDTKSLTELKTVVRMGIKAQEEKNGAAAQLQQQVQQLEQQLQQAQQQLQQAQNQLQQAQSQEEQSKMQIEKEKNEIEWYKARNDKSYKDQDIEAKKQQIQAEVLQLYDGNSKNDEIKNIV